MSDKPSTRKLLRNALKDCIRYRPHDGWPRDVEALRERLTEWLTENYDKSMPMATIRELQADIDRLRAGMTAAHTMKGNTPPGRSGVVQ